MGKEPAAEQHHPAPAGAEKNKKNLVMLIAIGVPVFVIQVVLIILLIKFLGSSPSHETKKESEKEAPAEQVESDGAEKQIFQVKDLIVNPAGSSGSRFLMTTVGMEVSSKEAQAQMTAKEVEVRDVLNTVFSSKDIATLANIELRDTLRKEIQARLNDLLTVGKVSNVFLPKFIIQ